MNESLEIPEEILGVKLDEASIQALKEGKETELIKGFISQRTGKPFDAFLKVDNAGKIRYRFPEREAKKTTASKAKSNKLPTSVGGVELDEEDIEDLKAGRETKLIVGIESKKKGKYYDAFLRWSPEKGIQFRFPGQDW
ncbi:MAG: topoisomerase C-terminal repeat-containing protein [Cytophagaceae bacterium]|jgi:DNA topoisomerase-3|nr:topoisomerase C-terminal repeat-containing protein [Cytophagaceae bacterium]